MKKKKSGKEGLLLGVKFTHDPSLDKLSGTVLFPEKLKAANKIVAKLKLPE